MEWTKDMLEYSLPHSCGENTSWNWNIVEYDNYFECVTNIWVQCGTILVEEPLNIFIQKDMSKLSHFDSDAPLTNLYDKLLDYMYQYLKREVKNYGIST